MSKPIKVGDAVQMCGQGLAANPHYRGVRGIVYDELGDGYWSVLWKGSNVAVVRGDYLEPYAPAVEVTK